MRRPVAVLAFVLIALLAVPAFAQQAGVSGAWKCVGKREGRPDVEFKLALAQNGAEVTGTASRGEESAAIRNGSFANGKLKFQVETDSGAVVFEATLSGDKLSGTVAPPGGAQGTWEGVRQGSAAASTGVLGAWKMTAKTPESTIQFTMELKQEGDTLSGKIGLPDAQNFPITKASFSDGVLKFTVAAPQGNFELEGKLEGDKLSGTYLTPSGAKGPWEGTRQGSATAGASTSIVGKWKIQAQQRDGSLVQYTLELNQEGDALSGKLVAADGETIAINKATFADNTLRFTLTANEGSYQVEGKLEGEKLTGTYTAPDGRKGNWEGKRFQ